MGLTCDGVAKSILQSEEDSRFADDTASRRSHSRKQSQVLLPLGASAPRNGRGWGAAAAASRPFLLPLLRARLP
eukprot:COSAG06_NODE_11969_length_1441_cov_0.757824_5_plen_73_part_01